MKQPGVSVVVPTLGRRSLIRAVRSVIDQIGVDVQLIVVDDSPAGIEAELGAKIAGALCVPGPRSGAASARNVGVQVATMPWLAFLDDDDEWAPHKLATQLARWSPDDDVLLSCRARVIIAGHTRVRPRRVVTPDESILDALYRHPRVRSSAVYLPTPSFVIPTRWARVVGFDEGLAAREDIWWVHQLQVQGVRVVQCPETLLTVHTHIGRGMARESMQSHLDWSTRLGTVEPALALGYLSGMAMRNAAVSGDTEMVGALRTAVEDRGGVVPVHVFAAAEALARSARLVRRVRAIS